MKSVCLRIPLSLLFASSLLLPTAYGDDKCGECDEEGSGDNTSVRGSKCIDGETTSTVTEVDGNGNPVSGSERSLSPSEGTSTGNYSPAPPSKVNLRADTTYRVQVKKSAPGDTVSTIHYQFGEARPGYVFEYQEPNDNTWQSDSNATTPAFDFVGANDDFDANNVFTFHFRFRKLPQIEETNIRGVSAGSISVPAHDTAANGNGTPQTLNLPSINDRIDLTGVSTTYSAGHLHWSLPVFGTTAPTPALIKYGRITGNGVDVRLDTNSDIKQLWTGSSSLNGTLVTVTQVDANTLKILLFEDIAEPAQSGGFYTAPAENTANRSQIIRKLTTGNGGYEIETMQDGKTSVIAYIPVTTDQTWIVRTGDTATVTQEEEKTVSFVKDANGIWNKTQVTETKIGGQAISHVTETFEVRESVGEIQMSRVQQVGGGKPDLTTLWAYYLDASSVKDYGRIKTVAYPDGSWVKYEYMDGTVNGPETGLLQYKYEPWLDGVTDPALANQTNCKVTQYEYASGAGGTINQRISVIKEKVLNNSFSTRENRYYNSSGAFSTFHNYLAQQTGVTASVIKYERREVQTNTSPEKTLTCYFPQDHAQWPGKMMGVARPDQTCASYNYERGDFNAGAGAFTVNTSGSYIRETITHGTLTSPKGVANLTTQEISIRNDLGRLYRQETRIYTGDDGSGNAQYELATVQTRSYVLNTDNSIQKETVFQDGRIVSETEYISGTETHYTDEEGIKAVTVEDALDRILTSTTKGKGGQVDRVTSYAYNGLTTVKTAFAGNLSLVESSTRDLAGRMVSKTDQRGITTTYDYQNGGRTTVTNYPGGLSDMVDRHLDSRTKSHTGDTVVDVRYTYSAPLSTTRLTRMEIGDGNPAPTARWEEILTDLSGRILEKRQPGPPDSQGNNPTVTTEYHYDSITGKLLRISSSVTDTTSRVFSYDALARPTLQGLDQDGNNVLDVGGTDRIGETKTSYHKEGNLWWLKNVSKTYQTNNSNTPTVLRTTLTRLSANDNGRASETRITNQSGNTNVVYTTIDRATATVTRTRDVFASSLNETVVSVNGLQTSLTDSVSNVFQTTAYDALGRQVSFTDARGATTRTSYNAKGQVERSTDALGNITRYTYYPSNSVNAGLLKQIIDPEGSTVIRTYNNQGQLLTEYGSGTYAKGYGYDAYGVKNILATYKNGGANPDATTTWHYDAASGFLTSKEYDNGKQTQYTYHANGRLEKRTWARLDSLGQPLTTEYEYNNFGDLTKRKYLDGTTDVVFTLDRVGRVTNVADAGGGSTITYNANNGQISELSYAGNHIFGQSSIDYSYSVNHHNLTDITLKKNGVNRQVWNYVWDDKGRKTVINNDITQIGASGLLAFTYDYLPETRRIKTVSSSYGTSLYATEIREIDKLGRLSSITNKNAGGAILTRHGYKYDRASRRTEVTLRDGSKWKYGYNFRGEVVSAKKYQANSNVLAGHQFEYEFDGMGNRTKARYAGDGNGTLGREISYTSNSVNQYTAISTPPSISVTGRAPVASSISINAVSVLAANRQGEHFFGEATESANTVPNGKWKQIDITDGTNTVTGHRWMEPENLVPVHDDDGNLTNDGRWDYTWNAENRLIKMETAATARAVGAPWVVLEFVYDYMGRRVSRKQTDKDSGGNPIATTEHHYRYNGWNCIARTNAGWTDAIYYTWGTDISGTSQGAGGVGGLLGVRQEKNGTIHISSPCYDGNGNVVAYLDSSGNVITRYEYDSFGNLIRSGGSVNGEKELYLFSAKPIDPVSGLYYYIFRYYAPVIGRFIKRDPIEEYGGFNLYGFVNNNGVSKWDYLGMFGAGGGIPWWYWSPGENAKRAKEHLDPESLKATKKAVGWFYVAVLAITPVDETILVCKGGQWVYQTVRTYKITKQLKKVKATGDAAKKIKLYHKGKLKDGKVNPSRKLDTTKSKESADGYKRDGETHEFEIDEATYREWQDKGLVEEFKDVDLPSGGRQVDDAVRINPPASGQLNKQ